jgi:hypothetical protein
MYPRNSNALTQPLENVFHQIRQVSFPAWGRARIYLVGNAPLQADMDPGREVKSYDEFAAIMSRAHQGFEASIVDLDIIGREGTLP